MNTSSIVVVLCMTLGACTASGQAAQPPAAPSGPAHHGAHGPGAMSHGKPGHGKPGHGMMGQGMMGQGMMGQGMMGQGMMKDCPMKLEGVTVRVDDVDGGAALVFSTRGDVAELRRRVAHMAEMHQKHDGQGCPMHATVPSPSPEKTPQP